jgi:hypothetical protein
MLTEVLGSGREIGASARATGPLHRKGVGQEVAEGEHETWLATLQPHLPDKPLRGRVTPASAIRHRL